MPAYALYILIVLLLIYIVFLHVKISRFDTKPIQELPEASKERKKAFSDPRQKSSSKTTDRRKLQNKSKLQDIEDFEISIGHITITKEAFQLSGLLHLLTNKIVSSLKKGRHTIFYNVRRDVGRYVVGDNDHLSQALESIIKASCEVSSDAEIILDVEKINNRLLTFTASNKQIKKSLKDLNKYFYSSETYMNPSQVSFNKAVQIVKAMKGSLEIKNSGQNTLFVISIPFYEDNKAKSNVDGLKKNLLGKKALFVSESKNDLDVTKYILNTFGIEMVNMSYAEFENKKPDKSAYDMAILKSRDLKPKYLNVFKTIYNDRSDYFKIIVMHDLFLDKMQKDLVSSVAHGELFNPITIGDVEEVLYGIFISKDRGKSVKSIENTANFTIKENFIGKKEDYSKYMGANILIVEDNKINQKILSYILTIDGINIYIASNGKEMLEMVEKESIDLIFTDINMPIMSGFTATKILRANKKFAHIPVVAVTAMELEQDVAQCIESGMNAHIPKPYKQGHIYAALDRYLSENELSSQMVTRKLIKESFIPNKMILDTDAGIKSSIDKIFYGGALDGSVKALSDSRFRLNRIIKEKNKTELQRFMSEVIPLYENIHATEMTKMFVELFVFERNGQEIFLEDYITQYDNNWKRLEEEVKRFMEYLEKK